MCSLIIAVSNPKGNSISQNRGDKGRNGIFALKTPQKRGLDLLYIPVGGWFFGTTGKVQTVDFAEEFAALVVAKTVGNDFDVLLLIILHQCCLEAFFCPAARNMDFLPLRILSADEHCC